MPTLDEACSTEHAPWYVVPANKKWYRILAVACTNNDVLNVGRRR
ncbi:MAG: hypothetical protein M3122_04225 [Actinomycetota bacterium]|nr:hypothetical protein [Actinomycetota bacterium]